MIFHHTFANGNKGFFELDMSDDGLYVSRCSWLDEMGDVEETNAWINLVMDEVIAACSDKQKRLLMVMGLATLCEQGSKYKLL